MKFNIAPGFLLVKPLQINPRETVGNTDIVLLNKSVKNKEFNEIEQIWDEHQFQAEVIQVCEHKGGLLTDPKEWIKEGDLLFLTRACTYSDAIIVKGHGVCAYIRPSEVIGVIAAEDRVKESKILTD